MRKEKLLEAVKELPAEFDLDQLLEKLVFVENVEKGIKQLEAGKSVAHDKVKDIVKKW